MDRTNALLLSGSILAGAGAIAGPAERFSALLVLLIGLGLLLSSLVVGIPELRRACRDRTRRVLDRLAPPRAKGEVGSTTTPGWEQA